MILPNEFEARNRLILSYLLAELPQEEIAELDAEMLTQPESLSVFEEGIADVMDAYADGTLDAGLAKRVEQLVSLHPSAQKQLSFARALKASRDSPIGKASSVEPQGSRGRQGGWLFSSTRVKMITALAAILLVLVSGLFLARRSATRSETITSARLGGTTGAPTAAKADAAPPVFTIILLPTVLRGAPEKMVEVPVEAHSIRLQALLPAGSTATVGTLRIADAAGKEVGVFSGLRWQKIDTETYVEVSLPEAQLSPGTYRVTLTDPDGKRIAGYTLTRSR